MTITDEMLYEAAPQAAERFLGLLPERGACTHLFSWRFEMNMRPLLQGRTKARQWGRILLIAAVLAALLCMSAGAIREAIFRMFRSETEESGTQYAFRTMDELGPFRPMKLTYLPDGYGQTDEYQRETEVFTRYILTFENAEDGEFWVEQQMTDRLTMGFGDMRDYTLEHPVINGVEAELYYNEEAGDTLMLWTAGEYIMEIRGTLSKEETVKVAENITWE